MAARLEGLIEDRVEVALPSRRSLGEGAVWCPIRNRLLWIDITRGKIFSSSFGEGDGATTTTEFTDLRQPIGTVVSLDEHRVVAALAKGVCVINLTKSGGDVYERDFPNPCTNPALRYNDGKCDPQGRLWVGTMGSFCQPRMGSLCVCACVRGVQATLLCVCVLPSCACFMCAYECV